MEQTLYVVFFFILSINFISCLISGWALIKSTGNFRVFFIDLVFFGISYLLYSGLLDMAQSAPIAPLIYAGIALALVPTLILAHSSWKTYSPF